jgi:RHS repeat-associated protein
MFTGREYDAETGLYYYRARFYAPRLGRFLQRDDWLGEIVNPSTLVNEYIYCANNPINWIDPMGWDKEKKEPWGKPGLTSAVSAGTKLHSDYGKAGEQFYHLIKDKWNYRFNKLGELVDHAGRVIGKAKGEAARALKYLKNIKPDFFLRIPIIIIIIPPELRRDPTSPFYDPESGGGMI